MNSKYIKIKENFNLKTKFIILFWILYLIEKEVYKLKILKKLKIYNIFYILLLKNNSTKKR